jgi:hypothetical protein
MHSFIKHPILPVGLLFVVYSLGSPAVAMAQEKAPGYRARLGQIVKAVDENEFAQVVLAVLNGSSLGPGEGWFKAGQSRYGWKWLGDRYDADGDGRITREKFTGSEDLFDRLDRDRDGAITKSDLDWAYSSPYWAQFRQANQILRRADANGDRKLSREEWDELFKELAGDKKHIDVDDLRLLLYPPSRKQPPYVEPSKEVLLRGLFNGELGSMSEGPRVSQAAPDFTLPTHDGKKTITLSDYRGRKPVVLVFGNFT